MKVLLDADVLIDVALDRPDFVESSDRLLRFIERGACDAGVAWHSLSNLSYLTGRKAHGFIRDLVQFVEVPKAGHFIATVGIQFRSHRLQSRNTY